MAVYDGISVVTKVGDQNIGSKEMRLRIHARENTGRENRAARVRASSVVGGETMWTENDLIVTQLGKAPFIELTAVGGSAISSDGGAVKLSGYSNLEYIKMSFSGSASASQFVSAVVNSSDVTTVDSFTTGDGYETRSGQTNQYEVEFNVNIPSNDGDGKVYIYSFDVPTETGSTTYSVRITQGIVGSDLQFSSYTASADYNGNLWEPSNLSVIAGDSVEWVIEPIDPSDIPSGSSGRSVSSGPGVDESQTA